MLPTPNMPPRFAVVADMCASVMVTPAELAARWRLSPGALANWRSAGTGIPYVKFSGADSSGSVRYRLSEVLAFEISRTTGPLTVERLALELAAMQDVPPALAKSICDRLKAVT